MKNLNSGGNKSGKLTEKEFNKMCKKSFKQFNHTITAFNSKGEPIPKSKLPRGGNKSGKKSPYMGRPITNWEAWSTVWSLLGKMVVKDIEKKTKK